MPDRILREGILESDSVNSLSWTAEVFYRRLFSAVDDFGNYHGKPELLLAKLYPLKLDRVSVADVDKWLTECVGAGLISKYEVQGKTYVSIEKFDQKGLKRKVSKFPNKVLNAQVAESVPLKRREEKRREIEEEVEVEETPPNQNLDVHAAYDTVKKATVEDVLFIEQGAMLAGGDIEPFKKFCLKKLDKMQASGIVSRYKISAIRSFMINDFEKLPVADKKNNFSIGPRIKNLT